MDTFVTADQLMTLKEPLKKFGEFHLPEGALLTDNPNNIPLYTVIVDCHRTVVPTVDQVIGALPHIMVYKVRVAKPPAVHSAKVFLAVRHCKEMHAIMNMGTLFINDLPYVLQESWGNYNPHHCTVIHNMPVHYAPRDVETSLRLFVQLVHQALQSTDKPVPNGMLMHCIPQWGTNGQFFGMALAV